MEFRAGTKLFALALVQLFRFRCVVNCVSNWDSVIRVCFGFIVLFKDQLSVEVSN